MLDLSAATLPRLSGVSVPQYDRRQVRPGILHIGVGNFVRTHLAFYLDACLALPGHEGWGMVGVGLTDGATARAKSEAFRLQDGLYTMTAFAPDGTAEIRVIGAMVDYLHAPANPEAVLARLADPDIRIVTLTITEGGYNIDEATGAFKTDTPDVAHDLQGGVPTTTFGYLVEGLARRSAAGLPAFTICSCDNLRGSGDTTRAAVLGFAEARDASLARWIADTVDFPNSMVDRLAPQVPDSQRDALNAKSGIADRLPVFTEAFTHWVTEDLFRYGRPAFEKVGVEFSSAVGQYLAAKGRLLNAAHVLMSYPSLLLGYRLVFEGLGDPRIVKLVETFLEQDARPQIQGTPRAILDHYSTTFVSRFGNPAIPDQLLRVAGDGLAKLPTFHAATLRDLIDGGHDLRREAFMLACFARYLTFRIDPHACDDRGGRFEPFEPGLTEADQIALGKNGPAAILRFPAFADLRLAETPAFRESFDRFSDALRTQNAAAALSLLMAMK